MLDNKSVKYWFVLYTHSKCEFKVADSLLQMQIDYFLPTRKVLRKWSDRQKEIDSPLFPGYIFIHADESERLKSIELKQVAKCLSDFGKPAIVPEWQIKTLEKMLNEKARFDIIEGIIKGKEVEISSGVFAGYKGIVLNAENKNQIAVSIELLNRSIILHVKEDKILFN